MTEELNKLKTEIESLTKQLNILQNRVDATLKVNYEKNYFDTQNKPVEKITTITNPDKDKLDDIKSIRGAMYMLRSINEIDVSKYWSLDDIERVKDNHLNMEILPKLLRYEIITITSDIESEARSLGFFDRRVSLETDFHILDGTKMIVYCWRRLTDNEYREKMLTFDVRVENELKRLFNEFLSKKEPNYYPTVIQKKYAEDFIKKFKVYTEKMLHPNYIPDIIKENQ